MSSTTAEFLARLTALDVRVWLDGAHLRVSAPAGALVDELREELRARKDELRQALGGGAPPTDGAADKKALAPLSFAQQRIWFFQQLEPGSSVYNLGAVLFLKGPLDVAALESSIGSIVARHEILRATYSERDGEPRIDVQPPVPWKLRLADLSHETAERQRADAETLRRQEQATAFDLERDVPLRTLLVRLAPEEHQLVVTFHHIAADGASLVVFARELAAHYSAAQNGTTATLPDVVQFPALARREREWISSPAYSKTLTFWKQQLSGDITPLALPLDSPRPAVQTFRGDTVRVVLPAAWSEPLRVLGRRHRATLPMTLLAAFDALLHRHSGDTDILVGVPVANRDRQETQDPIGMFVNTVVVRADVGGNPTFGELLDRVRQASIGAFANQELPFARLVDEIRPERDLSRTPFFQVMFNMFTMQVDEEILAGNLRITNPPAEQAASADVESKFELTLYAHEGAEGIQCVLAYNADLFARGRIERMMRHFARIVESALADETVRVGDIALDGTAVAEAVNHAMRPAPFTPLSPEFAAGTIAGRFHEVARRHATRTAVVAADATWTYAELEQHVKRIAGSIDAATGGRPARVALLCGRGANMIAAILGVLNRGGAYVPLDPGFPAARLSALIDDAQATVILAEPQYVQLATAIAGSALTVISTDASAAPSDGARGGATDTSYVLYTSGSSGRPKGVAQTNENVLSYVRAYINTLELTPDDRLTLVASYTFDASVVDIFSALLAGATLHPLDVRSTGVHELAREIENARITVYHSTPTLYRAIVPHLDAAAATSIRAIVLGGEKVFAADVDAFRERFADGAVFVNLYGATEATIALMGMVTRAGASREQNVSVGSAIPGMEIILLDEQGAVNPVRGEIALRSRHVAPGYWNAPDLTAAAFSSADGAGVRTYRTGDVAIRRPDGRYDVLGRRDQQVKIRGLRIEPGEIETVLRAHPAVRQSAVVADVADPENPVLIAFAALTAPGAATVATLKVHLSSLLPDYMVPASIVLLDELPLTRTGKVDRRALPTAHDLRLDARGEYVAPRDAVEEMLASIWSDVLGRTDIGVHANFFEVGGHSLSATQVIARIRAITGVELPLRTLFTTPTIEALARAIKDPQSRKGDVGPTLAPRVGNGDAPLSFSQERMWFLQQLIPDGTAYNMVSGATIDGGIDVQLLLRSFHDVALRHEMLRTTFAAPTGEPRQTVGAAPLGPVVTERDFSDLSEQDGIEAARVLGATLTAQPFDLEHGPLWRVLIAKLAGDRQAIVMVMHHIIGDVWSFGVLAREMSERYRAHKAGDATAPAPLPIQYTDFAVWQREWLSGDRLRQQLDHWTTRLAGLAPLELPTDHPRPPIMTGRGDRRRIEVPRALYEKIRTLSVREGVTPFMTLFAAFNVLLSRYTGQTDIAVGVPIANRTQVGVEALIGTFVNTLVHRNDLAGAPSFRELLRRVRSVALDAFAYQDLPFERLVRELSPERDASRSPVFQVFFNILNAPPALPSEFLTEPLDIDRHAAQFDIGLALVLSDAPVVVASYNTDLFDGATIERFLANYVALLEGVTRDAGQAIDVVPILPAGERVALLQGVNATAVDVPPVSVVSLIAAQTARTPQSVALEYAHVSLTYTDLDVRANRLARHLRASGVVPGDLVGVCMERSAELVVALLAVLKVGAAYVPIDPAYPRQRVKFVIDDSRARAIITETSLLPLVADSTAMVIAIDRDREQIATASPASVDHALADDAIAYVIYTSGSTGIPKGVEITHGSLANFLLSMRSEPGIEESDSLLAVTTVSFDIAGLELYLPLISGATVILASRDVAADGRLLRQNLESRKPTVMQATPATWRALIDAGWPGSPTLKALCGGETLPRDLAGELIKRVRELWNMYGPTETTIWSTTHRIVDASGVIPVGRPIANTRVYVLDANKEPLPRGVPGELYIGGSGVARGYFNRPELTSERFLPDPFVARPNARMYRTGDKVRLREDDTLEHLGRLDEQVKLRGYRIELGEIEVAISASPAVRQAAVAIRQDRLAAFVVFEPGQEMTATEVRSQLRQTLPDYMIPSLVVPVETIPLTPNGKIDRQSLPDPLRAARAEAAHVPPTTQTELVIASVWQELLGLPRVSTTDNFFELGGHSLLSMKAVHEIQQKTGWRPDARSLFFQTLGQIAAMRPDPGR